VRTLPVYVVPTVNNLVGGRVADPHNFDADPDPTITWCGSGSDFTPDADPDPDPSFQIKAQTFEKVLK
jgi:hypothetical protein